MMTRSYALLLAVVAAVTPGCKNASTIDRVASADRPQWSVGGKQAVPNDILSIVDGYRDLAIQTPAPVYVDPALAMLCTTYLSEASVAEALKRDGPHALAKVRIYMNTLAADAYEAQSFPYPVGAIIVKEKLWDREWRVEGKALQWTDGVGGMIKRASGYDPGHGDWEYFYAEEGRATSSGKLTKCIRCHTRAKTNDYVFGNWASTGY